MATTTKEYTGDGSQKNYTFNFPYLKEDDVKVSLNGTLTTEYTLPTATSIQLNTAPANGVTVLIHRKTGIDSASAVYSAGSAYRAKDLNNNVDQSLFFAQEVHDTSNPLISDVQNVFVLDDTAKVNNSVIYYNSSASKWTADTTQTLSTIVDGGSF